MNLFEARKIETDNIKGAIKRWPHFFETSTFLDNQKFLENWGIFIPGKKGFPLGYLKLWPQDFIVEEITIDDRVQTILPGEFLSKERKSSFEGNVIWTTLVKCGLSTIEAAEEIARKLELNSRNLKFAGIKDKHAITSQLISIKEGKIEKLQQISSSNFFIKDVFVNRKEIYLGQLKGNQFTILIRTGPNFEAKAFLKKLKETAEKGFFNFFYLQRFGVPRLINPYCGLYLLKGDYEKAVFTSVCKPGERELFYFKNMRKELEKLWGKWEEMESVLEFFPLTFQDERKLIGYLARNPNDFVGALSQIPRVVQLWLTSLAALLFNKLLSSHLKEKKAVPETLPLVLSSDKKDWLLYKKLLDQLEIFSPALVQKNLRPFPQIIFRKREQKTIEKVKILNQKIIPEGVILNFVLPKGCYATTFLSHFFNLISGKLPRNFSNLPIDTKANLGQQSLEDILNQFSDVVSSPAWRYLWRIY